MITAADFRQTRRRPHGHWHMDGTHRPTYTPQSFFSNTDRPQVPRLHAPQHGAARNLPEGTALFDTFLIVAGAHFLALLSPGPDFFLIVRTALLHGWRRASGVCAGVALANGLFIGMAWTGLATVQPGTAVYNVLQWGGCLYLAWLGVNLARSPGTPIVLDSPHSAAAGHAPGWMYALRMGLTSGLLNPKNALFYASLFTLLAGTAREVQALYGLWMVSVVLAWDLLVAGVAGHPFVVQRFAQHLRWIERCTGAVLLAIAIGIALHALRQ